jgi:pimeloyl-ACP methyl ester carboxylesterase
MGRMTDTQLTPLAAFGGARPPAPDWFRALGAAPPEAGQITVANAPIEYFIWGERGAPGLLLLHGNRAHARWWGPVAPLLAQSGFRVAAMSFSGMGGSGWRAAYHTGQLIEEMFAVMRMAGLCEAASLPFIGAHSFGAMVSALAAQSRGAELGGVVLVDSAVGPVQLDLPEGFSRNPRVYDSLEAALVRFRLAPPQPCRELYIMDEVGRQALVQDGEVWRWRFDPYFWDKLTYGSSWDAIAAPACKLAFIYGETSGILTSARLAAQRGQAPAGTPFIGIPEAGHHVMMDQPFALTAAMRAVYACWQNDIVPMKTSVPVSTPR